MNKDIRKIHATSINNSTVDHYIPSTQILEISLLVDIEMQIIVSQTLILVRKGNI